MTSPYYFLLLHSQINPELLAKLNQVKDMKDFVRIFKPKGFTLRREIRFKARTGEKNMLYSYKTRLCTEWQKPILKSFAAFPHAC